MKMKLSDIRKQLKKGIHEKVVISDECYAVNTYIKDDKNAEECKGKDIEIYCNRVSFRSFASNQKEIKLIEWPINSKEAQKKADVFAILETLVDAKK